VMSALCQKQTYAPQQLSLILKAVHIIAGKAALRRDDASSL